MPDHDGPGERGSPAGGDDPLAGAATLTPTEPDRASRPEPPPPPDRAARRRAELDRRRRRARTIAVLVALLAVIAIPVGWCAWQLDPPGSPGAPVTVEIEEGWGTGRIADELAREGVVGSAWVFKVWAQLSGAGPFAAGTYELRHDLGVRAAIDALEAGGTPPAAPTITVDVGKPGLTLPEIADRVGAVPGLDRERFLALATSGQIRSRYQPPDVATLEGLTYPAIYELPADATEEDVLRALVAKFDEVAAATGIDQAPNLGITPYQAAIVASLIQREAGVAEDRPDIAAVVYNRLRDGMPLQIDATVNYARGDFSSSPSGADLELDSPYNTYKFTGLPPTPIGTFTADDLTGALNPTPGVGYKFYVLIDPSGRHAFADTFEQHQANIEVAKQRGLL